MEILGDMDVIREHVKTMTRNLIPTKQTKVIVHYCKNRTWVKKCRIPEQALLKEIVRDTPIFPLERDEAMDSEDSENLERVARWHAEKAQCKVVKEANARPLNIEEPGAEGMTMKWLTADDNERSPRYCIRKVVLEPEGRTPPRQTEWEHQLYVVSGRGRLIEEELETKLHSGSTVLVRPNLWFRIVNAGAEKFEYLDIIPSITSFFGR